MYDIKNGSFKLEATIGSAKRLGLYRSPTLLAKSVAATARPAYLATVTTDSVRTSGRYPGYRSYQLEDHLGNVRVVVGDNKAADTSSGGLYLASRVLSASEYFPFGMTARQQTGSVAWAGGKYRWGFNGKELDRALGSNDAQDYGFRAYRPEIARFMSVDPLREKYPELTTYQFASNTPIKAVDLDGLEAYDMLWKSWSETSGHPLPPNINTQEGATEYGKEVGTVMAEATAEGLLLFLPVEELALRFLGIGAKAALRTAAAEKVATAAAKVAKTAHTTEVVAAEAKVAEAAATGAKPNPYIGRTSKELRKTIRSYQKLIKEHEDKLKAFREDPDGNSNKILSKTPEQRKLEIEGRIRSLEGQINSQKNALQQAEDAYKLTQKGSQS